MKNTDTKTLTFSGIICYIDNFRIDSDNFKEMVQAGNDSEDIGNSVHIFQLEYEKQFLICQIVIYG